MSKASLPRLEGVAKVTGRARYTADIHLPGILVGKLLRSTHPHARLLHVDVSQSQKLKGVKAVLTSAHFQSRLYGPYLKDSTLFPRGRVRYVGEPIAAIAAVDDDVAQQALELIRVEYDPLPPIFSPLQAIEPGAPVLHPDLEQYDVIYPDPIRYGNVALYTRASQGDIAAGLSAADRVFTHSFSTHTAHQGYIEPHSTLAHIDRSGRGTIWTTSQQPFIVRAQLAEMFGLPLNAVRVIVPHLGGAFGGKEDALLEPFCYLLSRETGRPVRITLSREEEFQASFPRHATHIEMDTSSPAGRTSSTIPAPTPARGPVSPPTACSPSAAPIASHIPTSNPSPSIPTNRTPAPIAGMARPRQPLPVRPNSISSPPS
jgi:CO/xanthine dehydrogenase Mo-binding subunit